MTFIIDDASLKRFAGATMPLLSPLPGHPYDPELLKMSPLYRKSRILFLQKKGAFLPALLSPERALSSAGLLENLIEYSPISRELEWSVDTLRGYLQTFNTDVFHEQNHRILWSFLRANRVYFSSSRKRAHQLLNLSESLVIILDMALSDGLSLKDSRSYYEKKAIYHLPDLGMRRLRLSSLRYRQCLMVALFTTYLRLEGGYSEDIGDTVARELKNRGLLIPKKDLRVATDRALRMDPLFADLTNPSWKEQHIELVMQTFTAPNRSVSSVKSRTVKSRLTETLPDWFTLGEKWLDRFDL